MTWKTIVTSSFDSVAFRLTHAELFRQYSKATTSRRLVIAERPRQGWCPDGDVRRLQWFLICKMGSEVTPLGTDCADIDTGMRLVYTIQNHVVAESE